jgi:hypothetical protein
MRLLIANISIAAIFMAVLTGCIESPVQQENYVINGKMYGHSIYDC